MKAEFDKNFDEWTFLECYLPDYYSSDYIAWIDDIDCVLNGEKTAEETQLEGMSEEELIAERNRMMRIVMESAFRNYIDEHYPGED